MEMAWTNPPQEGRANMDSEKQKQRKKRIKKIHKNSVTAALRRRKWESAAKTVLRHPVTLKQFFLKMMLRGIEEPDINLWWLYEWVKEGKVVELDDGYFQMADHTPRKEP